MRTASREAQARRAQVYVRLHFGVGYHSEKMTPIRKPFAASCLPDLVVGTHRQVIVDIIDKIDRPLAERSLAQN